ACISHPTSLFGVRGAIRVPRRSQGCGRAARADIPARPAAPLRTRHPNFILTQAGMPPSHQDMEGPGHVDDGDAVRDADGMTRGQRLRRRLIIAVDVALLLAVLVLLYQRALPQASAALGFGAMNQPAPLFTLESLD